MSTEIDCPICMDCIESTKNSVTTECGHCFHASCLMTSVAHNGFGCPYCRTAMAVAPEESDDEDEYTEASYEDEVDPLENNDMLRGFRFFFNNINGEEHDEDDVEEEIANEQTEDEDDEEEEEPKPSAEFIAQKLVQQGVTMEQLVKALLMGHEEYQNDENNRVDDELFGKMRIIISNYTPEQAAPQPAVAEPEPLPVPVVQVDYSAQPKQYSNITVRRVMMHV